MKEVEICPNRIFKENVSLYSLHGGIIVNLGKLSLLLILLTGMLVFAGCSTGIQAGQPEIMGRVDPYALKPAHRQPDYEPAPAVPVAENLTLAGRTIIVDPGHGGKDPGAGSVGFSKVPEKDIVLDIARKLANRLERANAKVIMTRSDDTFIELGDRAKAAESHKADLLISVHADAAPANDQAKGPTVYMARQASFESKRAARVINSVLRDEGFASNGVRKADFKVLVDHSRPSVLIECGFLTNRVDAGNLNNPSYRTRIAYALGKGVVRAIGTTSYARN